MTTPVTAALVQQIKSDPEFAKIKQYVTSVEFNYDFKGQHTIKISLPVSLIQTANSPQYQLVKNYLMQPKFVSVYGAGWCVISTPYVAYAESDSLDS